MIREAIRKGQEVSRKWAMPINACGDTCASGWLLGLCLELSCAAQQPASISPAWCSFQQFQLWLWDVLGVISFWLSTREKVIGKTHPTPNRWLHTNQMIVVKSRIVQQFYSIQKSSGFICSRLHIFPTPQKHSCSKPDTALTECFSNIKLLKGSYVTR